MSKDAQSVRDRIQQLKKKNKGNEDNNGKKLPTWKPQEGRNNLLFLPTPQTDEPFVEWYVHKGLKSPPYLTVECKEGNRGEECLICSAVEDLKKQGYKEYNDIWYPISQGFQIFSPIIDLDDMDSGVQWFRYGKSVLNQLETFISNVAEADEDDETLFYDEKSPKKIIINYDSSASPQEMYKLQEKEFKQNSKQLTTIKEKWDEWQEQIHPLTDYFTYAPDDEYLNRLLDEYKESMKDTLEATDKESGGEEEEEEKEEDKSSKKSKLNDLKE